jgi:hypothetical protein
MSNTTETTTLAGLAAEAMEAFGGPTGGAAAGGGGGAAAASAAPKAVIKSQPVRLKEAEARVKELEARIAEMEASAGGARIKELEVENEALTVELDVMEEKLQSYRDKEDHKVEVRKARREKRKTGAAEAGAAAGGGGGRKKTTGALTEADVRRIAREEAAKVGSGASAGSESDAEEVVPSTHPDESGSEVEMEDLM